MYERRDLFLRLWMLLALQNGLLAVMALHRSPGMSMAMMAVLAAGVIAMAMATAMMATRLAGPRHKGQPETVPASATGPDPRLAGATAKTPRDQPTLKAISGPPSLDIDDEEKQRLDGGSEKLDRAQSALDSLDAGLRRLAAGELRTRIEKPMAAEFEGLRGDFNRGLASLDESRMAIAGSADRLQNLCTQGRFELSRQRCMAIDGIPLLTGSGNTLREASISLRDQIVILDAVSALGAGARARLDREYKVLEASKSALTDVAGDNGKMGTIASFMRDVAFRVSMLSVDLSSAASDTTGADDRFKPMALQLRGLAEEVTRVAKQASAVGRQATLAVNMTTSALERGKREIAGISLDIETIEGRLQPVSDACAEMAEKLSRTGVVISEMALSRGRQSPSNTPWETMLEGITRELHVIGRNCSRFIPVTVQREGSSSDGRPPFSGRHLRLVKS